jgi:ESCRT-II complex subunit VPS36
VLGAIQSALASGVFRDATNAADHASASPSPEASFRTAGAGIGGIVREARVRERHVDRTLEQAFGDLSALMSNAKAIVDLAAKLRATGERELSDFDQMMTNMGILNPVTSSVAGSVGTGNMGILNPVTSSMAGSDYHTQLAKEMADYLPPLVQREGGMILLTDAYCLINRARGTQLISPQDCLTAASLLRNLATPLRLQEFSSGVKVIVADGAVEQVAQRIRQELETEADQRRRASNTWHPLSDAPSLSPLELSDRWHISIILAKQYLCVAEQQQILCRDESIHGLTFFINQF